MDLGSRIDITVMAIANTVSWIETMVTSVEKYEFKIMENTVWGDLERLALECVPII